MVKVYVLCLYDAMWGLSTSEVMCNESYHAHEANHFVNLRNIEWYKKIADLQIRKLFFIPGHLQNLLVFL